MAMPLGAHIRRCRQASGLSLRQLAERIHVNPAYLSRVERDIIPPSDTFISTAAKALEAESEEFFLLAGRIPGHWKQAIAASPARTTETLRSALATCVAEPNTSYSRTVLASGGTRAIEDRGFPFEHLS